MSLVNMDQPRTKRFLIVENDAKYAQWLQHAVASGWSADTIVLMDWTSFGRVRTAMTVRDYDVVMLALEFDEASKSRPPTASTGSASCAASPAFPK